MNHVTAAWRSLVTEIHEHRPQLRLAVRITVAVLLALLLSHLLRLPMPLWTILTALVLTQVSFGRSLKATIDYLVGTLFGVVYGGIVTAVLPHDSELGLVAVLALVTLPMALLGAINPRFTAATVTAVLVLMIPGMLHTTVFESALYRTLEVGVGALVAVAVSLLILPARAQELAVEAAAQMLELAAQALPQLFAGFVEKRDLAEMAKVHDNLGLALSRLNTIAAEAKLERIRFLDGAVETGPLRRTLLRLRHDFVMIGRAAALPLPDMIATRLGASLEAVAVTASAYLKQSSEALLAREGPPSLGPADAALDGCAEAFATIRHEGLTVALPVDTAERIFALGFALEQVRHNFHDLERCVTEAARAP